MFKITVWIILFLIFASPINAVEIERRENHNFITIVNPVRNKSFWADSDSLSIFSEKIKAENLPATYLIQYSLLDDKESVTILKSMSDSFEIGILLEVDSVLAAAAQTGYLAGDGDWARPDKLFLSGYEVKARLRMIDEIMRKYKDIFGEYPKSFGAWYIDAVSLNYLTRKYGAKTFMFVSDQYRTDKYGIWGQPWGGSYYLSALNPQAPANLNTGSLGAKVIQWAVRDPVLGYGKNVEDSTFSVQANDYIDFHNLDTAYFARLAKIYLNTVNTEGNLTIGLEVGQEGARFIDELVRQIRYIKENSEELGNPEFVSMSDFYQKTKKLAWEEEYFNIYFGNDEDDNKAIWINSPLYRMGIFSDSSGVISRYDFRDWSSASFYIDIFQKDNKVPIRKFISECQVQTPPLQISGQTLIDFERISPKLFRVILKAESGESREAILEFSPTGILYDSQPVFPVKISPGKKLVNKSALYYLERLSNINPDPDPLKLAFTRIEGVYIAGLLTRSGEFFGFKNRLPFFFSNKYPKETYMFFKTIPQFSFWNLLFANSEDACL